MIGTELLQLLQGDPLAQMRQQMGGPNPNPQAPPPQQVSAPRSTPPLYPTDPKTGLVVGGPGSGLPPSYERQPNGTYMPPGGVLRTGGPMPQHGIGPGTPMGPTPAMPPGVSPNTIAGPAPQGGPPAPGGAAQPPPPLPQSGPPSVASQSPPDLVQLYSRLMQQQRAGSAIDHGLALMASAYAAPGTQGQIMHSMDNQQPDASSMMNNLVQLQQMQNMTNARPGLISYLSGGADGSGSGGIPASVLNGYSNDQLVKLADQRAQSGLQIQQQGAEEKQKDLLDAQQKAPSSLQQMNDMDNVANELKGPMNSALTSIIASPTARVAAEKLLETDPAKEPGDAMRQVYAGMLSSDQLAALNQLKKLDAQVYSDAFQSTGSRRTQQEVQNLKGGISPLLNFNQSPDAYMSQFNDFQKNLHKTIANTYGAAGRVDEIPDTIKWDTSDPKNPKPMVDSAYLPNGDRYAGKGGQWASSPPKTQGGGNFDYAAIPSGAVYTAPDGTQRKKP